VRICIGGTSIGDGILGALIWVGLAGGDMRCDGCGAMWGVWRKGKERKMGRRKEAERVLG